MSKFTLEDWVGTQPDVFNKKQEFEERVAPLLEKAHHECTELGIPFMCLSVVEHDGEYDAYHHLSNLDPNNRVPATMLAMSALAGGNVGGHELIDALDEAVDERAKGREETGDRGSNPPVEGQAPGTSGQGQGGPGPAEGGDGTKVVAH